MKKIDATAKAVQVAPQAGQTIDGANPKFLNAQYESVTFVSNATNWITV